MSWDQNNFYKVIWFNKAWVSKYLAFCIEKYFMQNSNFLANAPTSNIVQYHVK